MISSIDERDLKAGIQLDEGLLAASSPLACDSSNISHAACNHIQSVGSLWGICRRKNCLSFGDCVDECAYVLFLRWM